MIKIAVLGMGVSGISVAKYFLKQKAEVFAIDKNNLALEKLPQIRELLAANMRLTGEDIDLKNLALDMLIFSPGCPLNHPIIELAKNLNIKTVSEIGFAISNIENQKIAITGTNGKTTVTLLLEHILNYASMPAKALGNIGKPLTDLISENSSEILALELSSFQLESLSGNFFDSGVILNITPDHLDRHGSLANYVKAKAQLFNCLKKNGQLLVHEQLKTDFKGLFDKKNIQTFGFSASANLYSDLNYLYLNGERAFALPISLKGKKNIDLENFMAAFWLSNLAGVSVKDFLAAFACFQKPAHRIEFVKKISGIDFYNDSKGTNPDATIKAVEFLDGPIVLIAGGLDKGLCYSPWNLKFAGKVRAIVLIGENSHKISAQMSSKFEIFKEQTLADAVCRAFKISTSGDKVLLSPGAASQDMFKDYAHRGDCFKSLVQSLG